MSVVVGNTVLVGEGVTGRVLAIVPGIDVGVRSSAGVVMLTASIVTGSWVLAGPLAQAENSRLASRSDQAMNSF